MWLQQQHCHRQAASARPADSTPVTRVKTLRNPAHSSSAHVRVAVFDKFKELVTQYSGKDGSSEGTDNSNTQAEQDAEMVRIDTESSGGLGGTSEDVFGPLAVLLVGFLPQEYEAFREMVNYIEADMVKVVPCTSILLDCTLEQALATEYPQYEQPALGQRRALFMSGMFGSEVVELISAYKDSGLPPCAFAAAVPRNYQRTIRDLTESVWKDHAAMVARQQQHVQGAEDSY